MIDAADIEAIGKVAGKVAAEIILEAHGKDPAAGQWLNVKAKARQLNVPTSLIYQHAAELGGIKVGNKIWRFPPEPPRAQQQQAEPAKQTPRKRRGTTTTPLLPIHR